MKRALIVDIRQQPPRTWEEGVERFLSWKKSQGAAKSSLHGYSVVLTAFFKRFPSAWSSTCRECLLQHMAQDGIAPATYNARLKTFRPFFSFCVSEGVFSSSPCEGLKYRKDSPRIVDHPLEDIRKLLDSIGTKTFATLRNTTLVIFSLDTGTRPNEALQLRPSDVDTRTRKAFIRPSTAKTRQGRTVYFSEHTAAFLIHLIEVRPEEWDNETPIFCTVFGDRWSSQEWTIALAKYAKKAGLKRFSAYDLRHQHALESLRNGMDVFSLQRGMGHANISMTQRYIALSSDDLRKAHEKASPVQMLFPEKKKRMGKI